MARKTETFQHNIKGINVVQGELLGHSQIKTAQRYAHLADSPLRAGVDAVAYLMRTRLRVAGVS
jgi:hypothetical protein